MDNNRQAERSEAAGWTRELLHQLVDNVTDYAILVSDLDGKIMTWNPGAERLFGYTSEEAIGMDSRMLFIAEDRERGVPETEMATAAREGRAPDERWHRRKDGSRFFCAGFQTALRDESGRHIGYAKIARDLTARIEAQERLRHAIEESDGRDERTGELAASNDELRLEVIQREESERLRGALIARIVRTQEDERKRIARDLHDNIGQQITGLQLHIQKLLDARDPDAPDVDELVGVREIAKRIDSEVDFLAWELRPSVLDDLGLAAAAETYVREWSDHFGPVAEFAAVGPVPGDLPPEAEVNLYRIVQEALNNVAKHARAERVSVVLERLDGRVTLVIEDDGVGFDPEAAITEATAGEERGLGLVGMRERAELVGGTCEIESTPGGGTSVFVRVPIATN